MDTEKFKAFLTAFADLTLSQRRFAIQTLQDSSASDGAIDVANDRARRFTGCPYCQSTDIWRWGFKEGVQRFRCKKCGHTFNALTGTPLAWLKRRDAWLPYCEAIIQGLSVRKAAELVNIHKNTSFRWRHRLLTAPRNVCDVEMKGIVEADETYFLESFKGSRQMPRKARKRGGKAKKRGLSEEQIPVLVVEDRRGNHFDQLLESVDKSTIGVILPQLLSDESLLCTDGAHVYSSVAKDYKIPHESVRFAKHGYVKERVFHVQHVNAYDSRLKSWMTRFKGVATKYLPNYLGWRRMLERVGSRLSPIRVFTMALG